MLVFTLNFGTEPDDLENVTRLMFQNIRKMDEPTFAVGATLVAGSDRRGVANIRTGMARARRAASADGEGAQQEAR